MADLPSGSHDCTHLHLQTQLRLYRPIHWSKKFADEISSDNPQTLLRVPFRLLSCMLPCLPVAVFSDIPALKARALRCPLYLLEPKSCTEGHPTVLRFGRHTIQVDPHTYHSSYTCSRLPGNLRSGRSPSGAHLQTPYTAQAIASQNASQTEV